MKINKMKAVVGILAVTSVASLVGSISGTMAWLQYNTRARMELSGTTVKCTENLQIRTVVTGSTTAIAKKVADHTADGVSTGLAASAKVIDNTGKVWTWSGTAWDAGVNAEKTAFELDGDVYTWNGSAWVSVKKYGDWKSALSMAEVKAVSAAQGHALDDDKFYPVTNPGLAKDGALGTFYSHPLCGYPTYSGGQHNWKPATGNEYVQFGVQFRTVDVDGLASDVTLGKALYLTDLTIKDNAAGKSVANALRIHLAGSTGNMLLGLGDGSANSLNTTTTHGNLDLDGDGDLDTVEDTPNNYSWTANHSDLLDYGVADSVQTYYNVSAVNGASHKTFYATQDQYGALEHLTSADVSLGTYVAADDHTTLTDAEIAVDEYAFNTTSHKLYRCTAVAPAVTWSTEVALANGDVYQEKSSGNFMQYKLDTTEFIAHDTSALGIRGTSLGNTVAGTDLADNAHLTFTVTMWLEGWQELPRDSAELSKGTYTAATSAPASKPNKALWYDTSDAENPVMKINNGDELAPNWEAYVMTEGDYYYDGTHYHQALSGGAKLGTENVDTYLSSIWDDTKTIGANFNIGFSFAIEALTPIQE